VRVLLLAASLLAGPRTVSPQPAPVVALPEGWLARSVAAETAALAEQVPASAPAVPAYDDYFHALGYSFTAGLFSREQVTPLAIGTAAALAFAPFDRAVSDRLRGGETYALDRAGAVAGSPIVLGALGGSLMLGSLATGDARFRGYAFTLSQGLIVAESLTVVVKLAVPRNRPDGTSRFSFPSSHASGSFALAAVTAHYYGAKAGIPLYALASLIALSRVTYGKHFPTDVLVGATIGYLSARAAVAGTNHVGSAERSATALGVQGFGVTIRF